MLLKHWRWVVLGVIRDLFSEWSRTSVEVLHQATVSVAWYLSSSSYAHCRSCLGWRVRVSELVWLGHGKPAVSTTLCLFVATAFGRGVYFARSFCYSAQPAYSVPDRNRRKYVFQCRVLTGRYCVGKPELMEPPARDKKSLALYDSVVDNTKNPFIFVVFQDNQAYPEYLITFLA